MTTWNQGDADVENVKQTYMSAVSSSFPLNRPEYICIHSASVRAVYAVQDSPLVPAPAPSEEVFNVNPSSSPCAH